MTTAIRFPGASWNETAAALGRAPEEIQPRAQTLHNHGGGSAPLGEYRLTFGEYAVPEVDCLGPDGKPHPTNAPNRIRRLYQAVWAQGIWGERSDGTSSAFTGCKIGEWIPWNDAWKPGTGNDRLLNIRNMPTIRWATAAELKKNPKAPRYTFDYSSCADPATQRFMGFFATYESEYNGHDWFGINARNGWYDTAPWDKLICAAASVTVGHYTPGWRDRIGKERGSGMPKMAGQIKAEAVCDHFLAGTIQPLPNALNLTVTNTMWRPNATAAQAAAARPPYEARTGRPGIDFVGPARQAERVEGMLTLHSPGIVSDPDRSHQTLHGTRIALNPDTDVDRLVAARLVAIKTRYKLDLTMKDPLARFLYGIVLTDMVMGDICDETGNYGMHSETDWNPADPVPTALWARAGVTTKTAPVAIYLRCDMYKASDWYLVNPTAPGV